MKVIIEKDKNGRYIAYNVDVKGMVAIGSGDTVKEAKEDFENSLEELAEDMSVAQKELLISKPEYKFDLSSLFEYYSVLNISALGKFLGINSSLLRQYKRGDTYISEKQLKKIEEGIHVLGKELYELSLT